MASKFSFNVHKNGACVSKNGSAHSIKNAIKIPKSSSISYNFKLSANAKHKITAKMTKFIHATSINAINANSAKSVTPVVIFVFIFFS